MGKILSKKKEEGVGRKYSNTVTSNISSLFVHRTKAEEGGNSGQHPAGRIVIRAAGQVPTEKGDDRKSSIRGFSHPLLLLRNDDEDEDEVDDVNDEDAGQGDPDGDDIDDDYPRFLPCHSSSMSRAMTPTMWKQMRNRRTRRGCDINDCVQTGVDVPRHRFVTSAGCVAPDADAYDVFREFFVKVLQDQHKIRGDIDKTARAYNFPQSRRILRFAIKSRRNVATFPFSSTITRAERRRLRSALRTAVDQYLRPSLPRRDAVESAAEFAAKRKRLRLFVDGAVTELALSYDGKKPFSGYWIRGGVARDWPKFVEYFENEEGTRRVWVNDADHVIVECAVGGSGNRRDVDDGVFNDDETTKDEENRIVVTPRDAVRVWEEHAVLMKQLELGLALSEMEWSRCDVGFLTSSPADVGAATRVVVWMHLRSLSKRNDFHDLVTHLNLRAVGPCGVDSRPIMDIYRIENGVTFGVSEDDVVAIVISGVTKLAQAEERLAEGHTIDDLLPSSASSSFSPPRLAISTPLPPAAFVVQRRFPPDADEEDHFRKPEYPGLKSWSTLTSRVLNREIYDEMTRSHAFKSGGGVGVITGVADGNVRFIGHVFDQIIRSACDADYVDAVDGCGGVFQKPVPGCVALNADSYRYFRSFYEKILSASRDDSWMEFRRSERRRRVFEEATKRMAADETFLKEAETHLTKVRIRILRNLKGFDFTPAISRRQRRKLGRLLRDVFTSSEGRLAKYEGRMQDVGDAMEEIEDALNRNGDRTAASSPLSPRQRLLLASLAQRTTTATAHDLDAGTPRDWPDSRDVWTSTKDCNVIIVLNDEAHLKLVVVDEDGGENDVGGGSLRSCVSKAASFYDDVEKALRSRGMEFAWDDSFGFLQASPAHLGNGVRVSGELRAPAVLNVGEKMVAGVAKGLGVTKGKCGLDGWSGDGRGGGARVHGDLCVYIEGKCAHEDVNMLETVNKAVVEMALWENRLHDEYGTVQRM